MRLVDTIVLHCSDSHFGDTSLIDSWHRKRGWKGIGYHYVILNSYPDSESQRLKRPKFWRDGVIENGRPVEETGAHTRGHNSGSIGICMIGRDIFTLCQYQALEKLLRRITHTHPGISLFGHYELISAGNQPKSCPNIDMDWLRELLFGNDFSLRRSPDPLWSG